MQQQQQQGLSAFAWSFCSGMRREDSSDGTHFQMFPALSPNVWVNGVTLAKYSAQMIHSQSVLTWTLAAFWPICTPLFFFSHGVIHLRSSVKYEMYDSRPLDESQLEVYLDSFMGAHRVSHDLKIGGNVQYSITECKWAPERNNIYVCALSQHEGMPMA